MSRKSRKGYYVAGEFVAAGSELDQQFRTEQKGGDGPSRTERKTASEDLQKIGEDLLTLRADLFAALPLPDADPLDDWLLAEGREVLLASVGSAVLRVLLRERLWPRTLPPLPARDTARAQRALSLAGGTP